MSANRKSVFLSDHALDILGPFSSGRLNGIIEKYGHLIQTQELALCLAVIWQSFTTSLKKRPRESANHGVSSLQLP